MIPVARVPKTALLEGQVTRIPQPPPPLLLARYHPRLLRTLDRRQIRQPRRRQSLENHIVAAADQNRRRVMTLEAWAVPAALRSPYISVARVPKDGLAGGRWWVPGPENLLTPSPRGRGQP